MSFPWAFSVTRIPLPVRSIYFPVRPCREFTMKFKQQQSFVGAGLTPKPGENTFFAVSSRRAAKPKGWLIRSPAAARSCAGYRAASEKSAASPSAIVGCVMIASRRPVTDGHLSGAATIYSDLLQLTPRGVPERESPRRGCGGGCNQPDRTVVDHGHKRPRRPPLGPITGAERVLPGPRWCRAERSPRRQRLGP